MGEQLSSRIIASMLRALNVPALHLDSRSLILTDEHFTRATPQYWETYAKIRWTVPVKAQRNVVVLGGFIGATEKGETTTLGRGGSDLTASMIGAAVNAEEIQIWKDVDGMLTCDPRLKAGGLRLRTLSYAEAAELAQAGAQILHPDTIAPARRLRIPVIIRNTFRPEGEGTSIVPSVPDSPNAVKSIVCQRNKTILEIRSTQAEMDSSELAQSLTDYVATQRSGIGFSVFSDGAMYISLDQVAEHRHLNLNSTHCLQVHIRPEQAVFTLVGRNIGSHSGMLQQLAAISRSYSALVLEPESGSHAVRLIVPDPYAQACLESLHRQFFTDIDPALFARTKPVTQTRIIPSGPVVENDSLPLRLRLLLTQKQAVLPK
jgi:aspartate kinase